MGKKWTRFVALVIVIAFIIALAGCTSAPVTEAAPEAAAEAASEAAPEAAEPATAETKRTYAIVYPLVHAFYEPIGESALKYVDAAGLDYEILIKAPEQGGAAQQIEIVENLINMKVDGIAIGATDPDALKDPINRAVEAGIPVVTFDSDAPDSMRSGYIGTGNEKAGYHLGQVVAEHLGKGGKILVIQGDPAMLVHIQRLAGLTKACEEGGIEILDTQTGMGDPNQTINVCESMIAAHPDFDALVGIGGDGGPAGLAIWKSRGWIGDKQEKRIITFDNLPENIQGIRDGIIEAIVSQNQHTWGKLIVDSLDTLNAGGTIEEYVDTGSVEVTLDNVDTYQD